MAPRRRRGGRDGSQDGNSSETDAPKNRPPNTAFRQQRMRAWQCVLTPKLIVSIFTVLAAIYLGFGAYLTYLAFTVLSPGSFLCPLSLAAKSVRPAADHATHLFRFEISVSTTQIVSEMRPEEMTQGNQFHPITSSRTSPQKPWPTIRT